MAISIEERQRRYYERKGRYSGIILVKTPAGNQFQEGSEVVVPRDHREIGTVVDASDNLLSDPVKKALTAMFRMARNSGEGSINSGHAVAVLFRRDNTVREALRDLGRLPDALAAGLERQMTRGRGHLTRRNGWTTPRTTHQPLDQEAPLTDTEKESQMRIGPDLEESLEIAQAMADMEVKKRGLEGEKGTVGMRHLLIGLILGVKRKGITEGAWYLYVKNLPYDDLMGAFMRREKIEKAEKEQSSP